MTHWGLTEHMSNTHCKAKAKSRASGQHLPSPQEHGLQRPRAQARQARMRLWPSLEQQQDSQVYRGLGLAVG